jgi:malonyl-CoA/methylmalonyl-CoA synthetase
MKGIELIRRAQEHGEATAVVSQGRRHSYPDLLDGSARIGAALAGASGGLDEARIAFLVPGSFGYVAVQWGVWRAGGIAVPLSTAATESELEHVLTDADVSAALTTEALKPRLEGLCARLGIPLRSMEGALGAPRGPLPDVSEDGRAMILYTSGTTSKPKGVVSTHRTIRAQITTLVDAWGWRPDDRIPLFLPLHHVHGIVNVLSCALWSGAQVEAFPSFDLETILARVADRAYTVFMAVPTIYVKLIGALGQMEPTRRALVAEGFRSMRLMISGSAALPAAIHETWTRLTGQKLLERYGMTEIGMGLSNPLIGERRPGAVGRPLPGVEIRLVDEGGAVVEGAEKPGEIQVRGPGVFREYWRRPDVTESAFVDGWFRTGDVAVLEDGYYRILGRLSVDIIKSGGYKLSALEIEDVLREHPSVRDCAVVGMPDDTWGEVVAAAVTTDGPAALDLDALQAWASDRLSSYKLPRRLRVVDDFPRNAMGKVQKPRVRDLFTEDTP